MTETTIRELETDAEWREAFPVMAQLRPHLDEAAYLEYVAAMHEDGYRLFALSADDEIVSVAGVVIRLNMYDGRHLWVHDLVTDADHRSAGHGLELLTFLKDWAAQQDCERIALSSGVQREDAHRFYEERADMDRASYVYKDSLD